MDKELRYGRVEIMESTAARVHVRWTYQSTDLHYKVWGDGPPRTISSTRMDSERGC